MRLHSIRESSEVSSLRLDASMVNVLNNNEHTGRH